MCSSCRSASSRASNSGKFRGGAGSVAVPQTERRSAGASSTLRVTGRKRSRIPSYTRGGRRVPLRFVQEPKQADWGTSAIFADPDGNQFVLGSS